MILISEFLIFNTKTSFEKYKFFSGSKVNFKSFQTNIKFVFFGNKE